MNTTYSKYRCEFFNIDFAVAQVIRDLKQLSKPRVAKKAEPIRIWCHAGYGGWVCHVHSSKVKVADWGKNMVQAMRNAKALHEKLVKERDEKNRETISH